jgi:ribonuclease-3
MKIFKTLNFEPTNINLYYEAFTHTSYSNENPSMANYERLEFLGDAILEFIVSEYLYKERHLPEGVMTKMRARYVCEEALATYAKDLKFESDIKLGGSELEVGPNDTILADVFEAFVAATYLDMGLDFTKEMVLDIVTKYINKNVDFLHDYKSTLQELVQTDKKSVTYEIVSESGPAHDRTFVCQVIVDGIVLGEGAGSSKKQAEQEAAKIALSKQAK